MGASSGGGGDLQRTPSAGGGGFTRTSSGGGGGSGRGAIERVSSAKSPRKTATIERTPSKERSAGIKRTASGGGASMVTTPRLTRTPSR